MTVALPHAPAARVAVVVTTFNHAHFLGAALDSITAQTRPADEIVVVDDGSLDNPAEVVAGYPGVHLLSQANAGLAAARNAGLAAVTTDCVLFLDADDTLTETAIADSLRAFVANPAAGFVYGAYVLTAAEGDDRSVRYSMAIGHDPLATFLECNAVGMHGTVLYSCEKLRAIGGFDPSLEVAEDYDIYLRMARRFAVGSHDALVARYRIHGDSMSSDPARMLRGVLAVHRRHKPGPDQSSYLSHWQEGRCYWKRFYVGLAFGGRDGTGGNASLAIVVKLLRLAPARTSRHLAKAALRRLRTVVRRRA